jgi:hypothetical protein
MSSLDVVVAVVLSSGHFASPAAIPVFTDSSLPVDFEVSELFLIGKQPFDFKLAEVFSTTSFRSSSSEAKIFVIFKIKLRI